MNAALQTHRDWLQSKLDASEMLSPEWSKWARALEHTSYCLGVLEGAESMEEVIREAESYQAKREGREDAIIRRTRRILGGAAPVPEFDQTFLTVTIGMSFFEELLRAAETRRA